VSEHASGASNDNPSEHRSDTGERIRFARVMRWTRQERSIPDSVTDPFILRMEGSVETSWRWKWSELSRWTRMFGVQLHLDVYGLPVLPTLKAMGEEDHGWVVAARSAEAFPGSRAYVTMRVMKRIREDRGIQTKNMAHHLGIVPGSLHKIETGEDPRFSTVQRYARALGGLATLRLGLAIKEDETP